jgi:hypothetical protein
LASARDRKSKLCSQLKGRIEEIPDKLVEVEADIKKYSAAERKAADLLQLGNEVKKAKEELPKLKYAGNDAQKKSCFFDCH